MNTDPKHCLPVNLIRTVNATATFGGVSCDEANKQRTDDTGTGTVPVKNRIKPHLKGLGGAHGWMPLGLQVQKDWSAAKQKTGIKP